MDDIAFTKTLTFRFIAILVLIVGLAIPLALVLAIVQERRVYHDEVSEGISEEWGPEQNLIGPFLSVQYRDYGSISDVRGDDSNEHTVKTRYFTPTTFDATVLAEHEIRERGLFRKPVLNVSTSIVGSFAIAETEFSTEDVERCAIVLVSTDSKSIRSLSISVNEQALVAEPRLTSQVWASEVLRAPVPLDDCFVSDYQINMESRNTNAQKLALVGDESNLTMTSTWPHPKFVGRQLPDEHSISDNGVNAHWRSIALARGFPSEMSEAEWREISPRFVSGYELFEPVTLYTMVYRAVRYGFLVVGITMMAIFCFDLLLNARFHVIQYAVVGAGLALFYLLLLALAEHLGYLNGYILAAATLSTITTGYAWFSTRNAKLAATIAGLMATIFAALYACLASADYALLIGSLLLVALLIGLMYATRGIGGNAQHTHNH